MGKRTCTGHKGNLSFEAGTLEAEGSWNRRSRSGGAGTVRRAVEAYCDPDISIRPFEISEPP
jgi:hypothetical protein